MSYRVTVNDKTFEVSFEYLTKYGPRPYFKKGNVSALTLCRVEQEGTKFSRTGAAMCSEAHAPKATAAVQAALGQLKKAIRIIAALTPNEPINSPMDKKLQRMRRIEWKARVEQRPDQYSRRQGRLISLDKVLDRSVRLREIKVPFLEAYVALDKVTVKPPHVALSDAAIEERIAAGHTNLPQEEAMRRAEARIERERKNLTSRAGSHS